MSMEFFRSERHVARVPHHCDACGETIRPGELYTQETGKYDGEFFVRNWCRDCDSVMRYFFAKLSYDDEFDYDEVQYSVQEAVCEYCPHGWCGDGADDCEEKSVWHCPTVLEKARRA